MRKREAFQTAFAGFEPAIVANFTETDVVRLMSDTGIVRSRLKIDSTIESAKIFEKMKANAESFTDFVWGGTNLSARQSAWVSYRDAPTSTPESAALSQRLKAKGFKFCGPVICYAFMQAAGMVNDHEVGCPRHVAVKALG